MLKLTSHLVSSSTMYLALLDGGWRETLFAAIAGDYHPLRLEAALADEELRSRIGRQASSSSTGT